MPRFSIVTPSHDPRHLPELWNSLLAQSFVDWQWIVLVNPKAFSPQQASDYAQEAVKLVNGDKRVKIALVEEPYNGIGKLKKVAFGLGDGDILVEVDHDDLLLPNALADLNDVFSSDPDVGFVYSDCIDFEDPSSDNTVQGQPPCISTAMSGWSENGFAFYGHTIEAGPRPGKYLAARSFKPSAAALSLIYWAPNHLRAWRRDVYHQVGGHDATFEVADDHDLLARTYLATRFHHIEKPLYLYRVSRTPDAPNTWLTKVEDIRKASHVVRDRHLSDLVEREGQLKGLSLVNVCPPSSAGKAKWRSCDFDLNERWPMEDSSVWAFLLADVLPYVREPMHAMGEIWRCLAPGGWMLSFTPSTDGRGGFQAPDHMSRWNENSFWYWTRAAQAMHVRGRASQVRFQEMQLETYFPSPWHKDNHISYVRAHLIALKGDYRGPGSIQI